MRPCAACPASACGGLTSALGARAPTVSITLDQYAADAAAAFLGAEGICVWDGHFYAARAVEVLGLADRGGLLRTGVSLYSTAEDIRRLLAGLERLAVYPMSRNS